MTDTPSLAERLELRAYEMGFSLFGVAAPEPTEHLPYYRDWLARDHHGEMAYLARDDSIERRGDLRGTMDTVRSVIVVAHEYYAEDDAAVMGDVSTAVVARYARGSDYHDIVKNKLVELLAWLDGEVEGGVVGRPYVDTGPILERDLARRAGLGWFGKNTMLIHPSRGSYFFLGLLLVDADVARSEPFVEDRCGSCRACLDACPTGALLGRDDCGAPVIDARRCISYLTIELRGEIPEELRPGIGNRVFGCDICQEVCPWNERFAAPTEEEAYRARPGLGGSSLVSLAEEVLSLDDEGFRVRFRGSPIRRTKRVGLLRNLSVAIGNSLRELSIGEVGPTGVAPSSAVELLARALSDSEPLVRGHAAWALGQARSPVAHEALAARRVIEDDDFVVRELEAALSD